MKTKGINYILLMILLLAVFAFSFPAPEINDLQKHRLSGKVKSLTEIKYSIPRDDSTLTQDKIVYQKDILFSQQGYEVKITFTKSGTDRLMAKFIAGPDGKPLEMNEYKSDGALNCHVTYLYDDKGNKTEALYTLEEENLIGEIGENTDYYYEIIQSERFTRISFINEYRGYCTEEEYIKPDNSLSFKFIYKYDIHGNKLESAYYHGNGRLSWLTKYKYDRYNNLMESRLFKINRIAVFSTYLHQFDDNGNWIYRKETREVHVNILTAGLDRNDMVTERIIEYY